MDGFLLYVNQTLSKELVQRLSGPLQELDDGNYAQILSLPLAQTMLGFIDTEETRDIPFNHSDSNWDDYLLRRLNALLSIKDATSEDLNQEALYRQHLFFFVAIASLQAFFQSNITGPPLPFVSSSVLFPDFVHKDPATRTSLNTSLIHSLSIDGEAAYKLIPNIELICLTLAILKCPSIKANVQGVEWAGLRARFMHQRLLSEISPTLQESIYDSLDALDDVLALNSSHSKFLDLHPHYLLEKATIHMYYGLDTKARETVNEVASRRGFEFALTGRLGKRTKYQERDTSQLVVLAKSNDASIADPTHRQDKSIDPSPNAGPTTLKPKSLDLNDDTLLESISFSEGARPSVHLVEGDELPKSLASLDLENQPLLLPLDSITLLLLASSITNTSPTDGLTREETLPYVTRVLEGGSSNWQVYTQALLLRSRIESYRPRTTERGLLQLQALVDQVISETTDSQSSASSPPNEAATTFLPRAKQSESAPATERLRYVYELYSPTRWELEAELAARWVSMGGLRTALEIYQRLEMWAEEALCWAAINREDKARRIIRKQLFKATSGEDALANVNEDEQWNGPARDPPPDEAPRLYCILGDIDNDLSMYEKAWEISNSRYARAQRSIGKYYFSRNKFVESAAAYAKSLKINQLNQSSWFALGCCLLELLEFERAAEAFSRTVQLDDTDAEAWSNLAAALLKRGSEISRTDAEASEVAISEGNADDDDEEPLSTTSKSEQSQQFARDALKALKRAAALKYENHRIWDNLLTVAASLQPPQYMDMIAAQRRVIELRGAAEGEKCIDESILESLVRHVISSDEPSQARSREQNQSSVIDNGQLERGTPRLLLRLFDDCVIPLITSSARLWRLVATLEIWRRRPSQSLAANEKAWRVVQNPISGWESGTEEQWDEVVQATEDLCDAYESLGSQPKEDNSDGEVVAKDWRFKARSAIRTVLGKAKAAWEDTPGWTKLQDRLDALKS